ncbi:universal stress protein [Xanthobacter autotrophicus]|uniref:universal stress protein n=1 Tax=Xanthobacter autotrophicus TaxID=280 RepID=UPI00372B3F9C
MTIKTIALLIDESPARETRMAYSANLAARHGAHLIGIFQLPRQLTDHAASSYVRGHVAISDLLRRQETQSKERIEHARTAFETLAARLDVRHEFRVHAPHGDDERRLGSLHADLVVAANPKELWSEDRPPPDATQLVTGVPFLLVPMEWQKAAPPQHILVGWNASREARRAIGDAMPLLLAASSVTVLIVDPQDHARPGEEPGVEVAMFLVRHGVRLTVDPVASHGRAIADVIIEHAAANGHDLIVLGAYSHARSKEIILGGVTRSLLAHAPVPLLISH